MKPPHHRSSFAYRVTPVSPAASRYRRYPSLSDDGQPHFPWLRWNQRVAENPNAAESASVASGRTPPRLLVRVIAWLAIAAIFIALVVNS